MKRTVWLWELLGFAVVSFAGTMLHFLYEWSGEAWWIAPFSGVNESTWEHMKLLFWPMLIYAVIQSFFFSEQQSFWCIKERGILLGLMLIPVIFYTYNGVIGKSPDWVNITIFFIAAAIVYLYETRMLNKDEFVCRSPKLSIGILIVIALLFITFTFKTPTLKIFRDPVTGEYGI